MSKPPDWYEDAKALNAELAAARDQRDILMLACHAIASWDEGDEVNTSFDEPCSAQIARDAIARVRETTK